MAVADPTRRGGTGRSGSSMGVDANFEGVNPGQLRRLLIGGQWQECKGAELVQFVVGESHSPISAQKFYPSLRYTDQRGSIITVPLSQVGAFQYEDSLNT